MSEPFDPKNELEQRLLDAQEGRISGEEFMNLLMESQVFMPILDRHAIGGFQASDKAEPLTLEDEAGQPVLILFTSPERAKSFVREYPGYEGGLLAEFKWVVERTGPGIGVALNPGWDVGLDLAPELLQRLGG